jgi:predicted LPLAT superfamily acyltransferase
VSSWSGKTRGGIIGYKIFVFTIQHLGLSFAYFLLRFVVIYFAFFSRKSYFSTFRYFHKILNYNFFKSFFKIFRNFYIFGQILIDKTALLAGFNNKFSFNFDGEEHLVQMAESKAGGLLLSAHIGSFEIAGHMLTSRLCTKINIVMYEAEHEQIKNYLSNILGNNSVNIISIKNDFSHIYEISNAIKNKELVCIHGDRFMDGSKTIKTRFFNREALFPNGPFYLAMKFDVPVSIVFAMKERKNHYHFYASPLKYYYQPNLRLIKKDDSTNAIIQDYVKELEAILLKYPVQWFNYYDFWEDVK